MQILQSIKKIYKEAKWKVQWYLYINIYNGFTMHKTF